MSDFKAKCTKFGFRWGFAPDPIGGSYSAPPDPYLYLRGLFLTGGRGRGSGGKRKGRERKGKERKREREGEGRGGEQEGKGMGDEKGREGKGREEEGKGFAGSMSNCFLCACSVATYLRCG